MKKKNNTLYLECNSGISGDMAVAALLDLGADRETLEKALESIPIDGFQIKISRVKKAGLEVCDFRVVLDETYENHDHDMAYLFGEGQGHEHCHEEHERCHEEHERCHEKHAHHHAHRGLAEILHIIEHTDMTKQAKETAERIFRVLAKAEAKAHGVGEEEVHFHEVGAVDSIVDIISAAVCLDNLGVTECIVPVLCEGRGMIRCQHGIMSVPVPAVLNIAKEHALKLSITDIKGELVTPTGAAIAAAVKTTESLPESFRIIKTGMGAGKRAYERPSILRAMLIEEVLSKTVNREECDEVKQAVTDGNGEETDTVNRIDEIVDKGDADVIYKLETTIDDCSGEGLGYVMERLFEAGAKDAHYLPVYMKKNRPAYQLNVICKEEQIAALENIIFAETTTIGIRRQRMERSVLPRRTIKVTTDFGEAAVKECRLPGSGRMRYYPEYDGVVKLCAASGKSYQEIYHLVMERCAQNGRIMQNG